MTVLKGLRDQVDGGSRTKFGNCWSAAGSTSLATAQASTKRLSACIQLRSCGRPIPFRRWVCNSKIHLHLLLRVVDPWRCDGELFPSRPGIPRRTLLQRTFRDYKLLKWHTISIHPPSSFKEFTSSSTHVLGGYLYYNLTWRLHSSPDSARHYQPSALFESRP